MRISGQKILRPNAHVSCHSWCAVVTQPFIRTLARKFSVCPNILVQKKREMYSSNAKGFSLVPEKVMQRKGSVDHETRSCPCKVCAFLECTSGQYLKKQKDHERLEYIFEENDILGKLYKAENKNRSHGYINSLMLASVQKSLTELIGFVLGSERSSFVSKTCIKRTSEEENRVILLNHVSILIREGSEILTESYFKLTLVPCILKNVKEITDDFSYPLLVITSSVLRNFMMHSDAKKLFITALNRRISCYFSNNHSLGTALATKPLDLCEFSSLVFENGGMAREKFFELCFEDNGLYQNILKSGNRYSLNLKARSTAVLLRPYKHHGVCNKNAHYLFALLGTDRSNSYPRAIISALSDASFKEMTEILSLLKEIGDQRPYIALYSSNAKVQYIDFVQIMKDVIIKISAMLHHPYMLSDGSDRKSTLTLLAEFLEVVTCINSRSLQTSEESVTASWHVYQSEGMPSIDVFPSALDLNIRKTPERYSPLILFRVKGIFCNSLLSASEHDTHESTCSFADVHTPRVNIAENYGSDRDVPKALLSIQYFTETKSCVQGQLIFALQCSTNIDQIFNFLKAWEKCFLSSGLEKSHGQLLSLSFKNTQAVACNAFGMSVDVYDAVVGKLMQLLTSHMPSLPQVSIFNTHEYIQHFHESCMKNKFALHKFLTVENLIILQKFCSFSMHKVCGTSERAVNLSQFMSICSTAFASAVKRPNTPTMTASYCVKQRSCQNSIDNSNTAKNYENSTITITMKRMFPSDWALAFLYIVGTYNLKMRCPPQKMKVGNDFLNRLQNALLIINGFAGMHGIPSESSAFERMHYPVAKALRSESSTEGCGPKLPSPIGFAYIYLDQYAVWLSSSIPHLQKYLQMVQQTSLDTRKLDEVARTMLILLNACACTLPPTFALPISITRSMRQYFFSPDQAAPFLTTFMPILSARGIVDFTQLLDYLMRCDSGKYADKPTAFRTILPYSLGACFHVVKGAMDAISDDSKSLLSLPQVSYLMMVISTYLKQNGRILVRSLESPNFAQYPLDKHIIRSNQAAESSEKTGANILEAIYRRLKNTSFCRMIRNESGRLPLKQAMEFLTAFSLLHTYAPDSLIASLRSRVQVLCRMRANRLAAAEPKTSSYTISTLCSQTYRQIDSIGTDLPSGSDFVTLLESIMSAQITDESLFQSIVDAMPFFAMHKSAIVRTFSLLLHRDSAANTKKLDGHLSAVTNAVTTALETIAKDGSIGSISIKDIKKGNNQSSQSLWTSIGRVLQGGDVVDLLPSNLRVNLLFKLSVSLYDALALSAEDTVINSAQVIGSFHNIPVILAQTCEDDHIIKMDINVLEQLTCTLNILYSILNLRGSFLNTSETMQSLKSTLDFIFLSTTGSLFAKCTQRLHALSVQPDFPISLLLSNMTHLARTMSIGKFEQVLRINQESLYNAYAQLNPAISNTISTDTALMVRFFHTAVPHISQHISGLTKSEILQLIDGFACVSVLIGIQPLGESQHKIRFAPQSVLPVSLLTGITSRLIVLRHEITFDDLYHIAHLYENAFHMPLSERFLEEIETNVRMLVQLELGAVAEEANSSKAAHLRKIGYLIRLLQRARLDVPDVIKKRFIELWQKSV